MTFAVKSSKIIIMPKLVVDRFKFPTADDEYTPAQRRMIDAALAEGLADLTAEDRAPRQAR